MFTTNTNAIKPNSNSNSNNNNNNNISKDDTEKMENDIDRSTAAAFTALTIQEDTQNKEASHNVSCSNSTDATIGKKKFYILSRQLIIIKTVLY